VWTTCLAPLTVPILRRNVYFQYCLGDFSGLVWSLSVVVPDGTALDRWTGSLRGRIVCPVARPPVSGGVIEIADGRIVAIHDQARAGSVDLGDVAIVPGLVNAHTHLEFSNLQQPLGPPRPFAAWIRAVVAERRRRRTGGPSPTVDVEPDDGTTRELAIDWLQEHDPLAHGLQECLSTGTALIGDIATAWPSQADDPSAILGAVDEGVLVSFRELFSPISGRNELLTVDEGLSYVQGMLQHAPRGQCGFSPHAPYSVTRDVLRWAVGSFPGLGRRNQNPVRLPVAMHLAETREELELLAEGSGPLVEMLDRVGLWNGRAFRRGTRSMDTLRELWFARQVLVIHGNYLDEDELRFLGRNPHMTLVYCPRTHAYFGHERYPLEAALRHGVRVALGTDSRA
jgi:aminodeoxyfutalosine deaminase